MASCILSCLPTCFGLATLCGLRDRICRTMVFFPPEPEYEFDLKANPPMMTCVRTTRRGNKKRHEYQNKYLKLGFLDTIKGQRIAYLHIDYPGADTTIIFSHGNATDIGHMRDHFLYMAEKLKISVLAYDYSGYGLSSGRPSPALVHCDIEAVYHHYMEHARTKYVLYYGQSLGSGPTTYLARKFQPDGVIIHSGFKSCLQVIDAKKRAKSLWFDIFPNVDNLKQNKAPVFVIHGRSDKEIPLEHGIELTEASQLSVEPWFVQGGQHNNIEAKFRKEYFKQMRNFLKYVRKREPVHPVPESGSKGGEDSVVSKSEVNISDDTPDELQEA